MTRRSTQMRFYAMVALCSLMLKNQYFSMGVYWMSLFWNIITVICFLYIIILWVSAFLNGFFKKNDE